jgi:GR25 family glycosyltransferase involved in LPS biosynthesis
MINDISLKYYLIHNLDINRKKVMLEEFKKWEFDLNNIKWIEHPNKDEIDDELLNKLIIQEPSYSSSILVYPDRLKQNKGLVSCTYKHYLCLKDIIENNYDYGVIIEDNICFKGKIPQLIDLYIKQLNELYGEWDILFDGSWTNYIEQPTTPNIFVYPKTNEITQQCHGGTKAATFYLVKKECAKKLIEHYIPFNNSPDWWMNDLFRKLNIKSFWVEPTFVCVHKNHKSTSMEEI